MEGLIKFQNGTITNVATTCVAWCKEQHYVFEHNEAISSFWLLAITGIILFIYWALRNSDIDVLNRFLMTYNIPKDKFDSAMALAPLLCLFFIASFIVYYVWRFS